MSKADMYMYHDQFYKSVSSATCISEDDKRDSDKDSDTTSVSAGVFEMRRSSNNCFRM